MKRITEWFLIIFFLVSSLIPLIGWITGQNSLVFASQQTTRMPEVIIDGKLNTRWTLDFDDHWGQSFPFQSFLTSSYNRMVQKAFGSSPNQKVIIGKEGFYYFAETVDDLLKHQTLTQGDLRRLLRVLEMQSEYVKSQGAEFTFFIAPNKATVYPEYLPDYMPPVGEQSNLESIASLSGSVEIYHALEDLLRAKREQTELIYHKEDSHWNNLGAYEAYRGLMAFLGREPVLWGQHVEAHRDFQGDLTTMFYPDRRSEDIQWVDPSYTRKYIELRPMRTFEDIRIETRSSSRTERLLMYRDSFANTLIPFLSDSFEEALYLRSDTVDLREVDKFHADVVVYELVERDLNWILQRTPIMPAPEAEWQEEVLPGSHTARIEVGEVFSMTFINAQWLQDADAIERVLVKLNGQTMEAFPLYQDDNVEDDVFQQGFSLYTAQPFENPRVQYLMDGRWYELQIGD